MLNSLCHIVDFSARIKLLNTYKIIVALNKSFNERFFIVQFDQHETVAPHWLGGIHIDQLAVVIAIFH